MNEFKIGDIVKIKPAETIHKILDEKYPNCVRKNFRIFNNCGKELKIIGIKEDNSCCYPNDTVYITEVPRILCLREFFFLPLEDKLGILLDDV